MILGKMNCFVGDFKQENSKGLHDVVDHRPPRAVVQLDTVVRNVVWQKTADRFGRTHASRCGSLIEVMRTFCLVFNASVDMAQAGPRYQDLRVVVVKFERESLPLVILIGAALKEAEAWR